MPLLVRDLALALDDPPELLLERAARRLRVPPEAIRAYAVVRRSLDARRWGGVGLSYNIELALRDGEPFERRVLARLHGRGVEELRRPAPIRVEPGCEPLRARPVIVGFGPGGMFAGLLLARAGYRPVILERGRDVRTRHRDILERFYLRNDFDGESNLLFGEGGAGAYSDGKLYTRVHDPRVADVLRIFFEHGAPADILIDGRPHLGSDRLPTICRRFRESIEAAGGEVRFGARVEGVSIEDGRLRGLVVNGRAEACDAAMLAIGHSARDTVRMLAAAGVRMLAKPMQFGVRIEHPQALVDRWQYQAQCGDGRLPAADYRLVARRAAGERGDVFSFCMCPGGTILPTNESPGLIATNGASRAARRGRFANSGLVLTIEPAEFNNDPLEGLRFLEEWERRAFERTGGSYAVPAQRASDFLAGRESDGELSISYPLGGRWTDVRSILPAFVAEAIAAACAQLDARRPGFAGAEAILTGPESRASGPVRIARDERSGESVNVAGLYPVGEGAGYAGGIVSAAIDGMVAAERMIRAHASAR